MWSEADLRKYQLFFIAKVMQCFAVIARLPGVLLALEPGAGKTVVVLTALRRLLDQFVIRRALIVAPLLVAQTVWPAEMDEWEHLKPLTWTLIRVEDDDVDVLAAGQTAYDAALARYQAEAETERQMALMLGDSRGDARKRAKALFGKSPGERAVVDRQKAEASAKERKLAALVAEDTEIHIINKEAILWLWEHLGEGAQWHYDVLILDDLREGRSGRKRSKRDAADRKNAPLARFGVFTKIRKHVKATIQLTGTPTPNGLHNMWGLIYLIDLGRRLGAFKSPWLKKHFHLNEYHQPKEPKEGAFDDIMGKVKDVMFSLDPADYPQLPPFTVDPIHIKLPAAVLKEYRKFQRELVSEEYDVEAVSSGVLHGKLLQFANGSMYQEDGNDVWIHDAKIDALKLLIERLNGTPLLVAYTYQFDADRILAQIPGAVLLRPGNAAEVVKRWNRDEIPVLLAHRASAGHGLNMQKGTGHMCEYGLTSDAELYLQFRKRVLRPGRKTRVFNHVLIADGTIDEDIFPQYLDPKIAMQTRVLREVQVSFQTGEAVLAPKRDLDDLLGDAPANDWSADDLALLG